MTIKEIRKLTGLSQKEFARLYGIPLRSLENWESENPNASRKCPDYVTDLLGYRVKTEWGDMYIETIRRRKTENETNELTRYLITLDTDNPNVEEIEEAMEYAVQKLNCRQGIYHVTKDEDEEGTFLK